MRFLLHEAAEADLNSAVAYYESCKPGLGTAFATEVVAAIALVCAHPGAGTWLSEHSRRCLVKRFPFGVIYQAKADRIDVIAVADLRRRPGYWHGRVMSGDVE